jgi:serine/threonine-protein phosphatase 5
MIDENTAVDSSYDGPHLPDPITPEFIKDLIAYLKKQKKLHAKYAYSILLQIKQQLKSLDSLITVEVPEGTHLTVCGDVHGQFYDLCNIFELNGLPSESNPYLCMNLYLFEYY